MLFMESYMCYCSVRLGVIVVAIIAILRCTSLSIVLFVLGVKCFDPLIDLFEHDADYKDRKLVRKLINWIENSPENFLITLQIIFYAHIAAAILSIWGSLKLQKWLVLPLAFFELINFLQFTFQHIFLMIMLKKQINLGLLIILTLIGSFYILFIGYNAFACVAMFQVISLVRSPQYRELYGDDPFHPLATKSHPHRRSSVQQLRVLKMDNADDTDIDEQKRLSKLGLWPRRYPQVVSVIPVQAPYPQLKWWQLQAMDTGQDKLQPDSSAVYRNWQQAELLNGVGGEVQRKNALNRRYAESQMHRWY